jgi:hypothetical protein
MKVHIAIPSLFLPPEAARAACAGLSLPALETMLARARAEPSASASLEAWLCERFGLPDSAVAPVTLRADGMEPGAAWWLRADPAYAHIRQNELILQAGVPLSEAEAGRLCAALNAHFSGAAMRFFAPHPQRWYVRLEAEPEMRALPLSQVAGRDIRALMPQGRDALRWHGVLNEIQMLLHGHEVNAEREACGETPVNSVWLWGGGREEGPLEQPCGKVCGDSELAGAFARAADTPHVPVPDGLGACLAGNGDAILVWEGLQRAVLCGDLHAWRSSLLQFEQQCAAPLFRALRAGRLAHISLEAPGEAARRFVLTRGAAWKLWLRPRPLAQLV